MSNNRVYLDDIYASEACKGSTFRAVVMMAQEARFINEQANREGYVNLTAKPTTIAMNKFKANKLSIASAQEAEEAPQANSAPVSANPQDGQSMADSANDAFGI
ncbi:hypothetical protein [uncultured Fibrobacter sp.]|uniref:hypothetical protein n=1 Tax=uncultured Fibrobacter sp. TaxID=261512 RepID=UPI00259869DA|nr:hypothetical protein [uncultured Fibrobacter sp.]